MTLEHQVTELLRRRSDEGGFRGAMVCTVGGLAIAAHGTSTADDLAAFTSLFEDVVARAARDLGLVAVDEVTVRDGGQGRFVVRPLVFDGRPRAFLVVHADVGRAWRRLTSTLVSDLVPLLAPLMTATEAP